MKAFAVLMLVAAATSVALAQDMAIGSKHVLVDPDFGLTFETPDGFQAELVGQTPDGLVMITVTATEPGLPPLDPSGNLCDITFRYDPVFGQGDQEWVNNLVDDTGFYEQMAQAVIVPGTIESSEHFTHRGSSAHRFNGQHELGGAFAVAAIPSSEGFVLVTCISANAVSDWSAIAPVIDAITMPGQPRDHLIVSGPCQPDLPAFRARLEQGEGNLLKGETIAELDVERKKITDHCGGLHGDAVLDQAVTAFSNGRSYRALRYEALARIGSELLTQEQHAALDGGRKQIVAASDEATGDRYLRYMHFIIGLRSLD